MKTIPKLISVSELSLILNINEKTIKTLAKTSQIPFLKIKRRLYFNLDVLFNYFSCLEGGTVC